VLDDPRFNHLRAEQSHRRQGAGLVLAHEAAIPDHIGCQDGSKATFYGMIDHRTLISSWL
jgi:hypothetical protein